MAYIKSINVSLWNIFNEVIYFTDNLNIISGVNGTGKTTVLSMLKTQFANSEVVQLEGSNPQILAISPKRNAERKSVESALQYIRQNSRTKEQVFQEAIGKAVGVDGFTPYESLGSLFVYDFEERSRNGDRVPTDIMKEVESEYNSVIKSVFPEYEILSEWNPSLGSSGSPVVKLKTNYGIPIDLSSMSTGESEVLSLMFNIFLNKERTDIFLIDEPEVHLNWSLEKGLFSFFDDFTTSYQKQIILVTHSRVIFDNRFRPKTQFFRISGKKIRVDKNPPVEYLEQIAGETASIISTTAPPDKTFFVEDEFHKLTIETLMARYGNKAEVIIMKDASGAIQNLYKVLKSNDEFNSKWVNAYLMVDGDGREPMYNDEPRFIHLSRFTIESYFFDINTLSETLDMARNDLFAVIIDLLKNNSDFSTGKHTKFIKMLTGNIKKKDITLGLMSSFDCSDLLKKLLEQKRIPIDEFIKKYIANYSDNDLEKIFDEKLIKAIKA